MPTVVGLFDKLVHISTCYCPILSLTVVTRWLHDKSCSYHLISFTSLRYQWLVLFWFLVTLTVERSSTVVAFDCCKLNWTERNLYNCCLHDSIKWGYKVMFEWAHTDCSEMQNICKISLFNIWHVKKFRAGGLNTQGHQLAFDHGCMHEAWSYSLVIHQFLEMFMIFIISQCGCSDQWPSCAIVHLVAIHS